MNKDLSQAALGAVRTSARILTHDGNGLIEKKNGRSVIAAQAKDAVLCIETFKDGSANVPRFFGKNRNYVRAVSGKPIAAKHVVSVLGYFSRLGKRVLANMPS